MRRRVGIALAFAVAVLLLFAPRPAGAEPRLRLDRIDVAPSWFPGLARVRFYVSAVRLEGSVLAVNGDDAWELSIDGRRRRPPIIAGYFAGTGAQLAVAIVIETAFDYREDLATIKRAAQHFVDELPEGSAVTVIGFAAEATGGHKLSTSVAAARHDIDALDAATAPAPPVLLRATERAVATLRRAKPDIAGTILRKVVIVVADGRDPDPTPQRYRDLATKAAKDGIRIHTIAFSPMDNRRPLLGLGELSKRSMGTFRWVRDPTGFGAHFRNIQSELSHQYVLTLFSPADAISGHRVQILHQDIASNEVRVPQPACGEDHCPAQAYCAAGQCVAYDLSGGRGILGWIAIIAGVVLGGFAILLAVGFVLTKRREKAATAPPAAHAPPKSAVIAAVKPGAPSVAMDAVRPGQPSAQMAAAAPRAGQAPGPAPCLLILSGPLKGQRLALFHGFSIGKAKGSSLFLGDDPFASTEHAQMIFDTAQNVTLIDKRSTNGTFVNGVRITEMRLSHGMSIRFGNTEARFLAQ
ncbi:MAG TPA: FHA domain-containing protein [Kofleriaceae bacterium]|nr:FHA domain-containing protein [Kofleriaceae bacterium]